MNSDNNKSIFKVLKENKKKAVIISCFHGWYNNRLKPIIKTLEDREYEVTCYLSDFDHIKKEYVKTNSGFNCYFVHVPSYNSNISIKRIISHLLFGNEINKLINNERPDLIYLLVPPNNTAKYCTLYKKCYPNTKLIIDIIDMWPESFPFMGFNDNYIFKRWKKLRDDAIKESDFIFTECDYYQQQLLDIFKEKKMYSLFLFKEQSLEERQLVLNSLQHKKTNSKNLKFAYLGSINNIIDIDGICNVIYNYINSGYQCDLHAIGDGEKRELFEQKIMQLGCKTKFYGKILDETSKINILTQCDYGLNMMKDISVGLTLKSIDYFSYGLPIINNIKGDTWELVEKENIGINVSSNFDVSHYDLNFSNEKILQLFYNKFSKESFMKRLDYAFGENDV